MAEKISKIKIGNIEYDLATTIENVDGLQSTVNGLQSTLDSKLASSLKGAANGLAELDSSGKVPSAQLPSYVDDVIEGTYVSSTSFKNTSGTAITGETGKIYVDTTSNKTYRWSGSAFTEISASLALGETSSTAYRGDRGKTAYNHSQITTGNPHGTTKTDLGLGNVENKSSATIRGELTKANVTTALGYTPPTTNTTYSVVSTTADGLAPKRDGSTTKFLRGDGTWAVPPDTDTVYTHPTYTAKNSGLYKVTVDSTGHVSGTTAVAKSDITALGIPAQDTTYSAATTSAAGLMSANDKAKLDYSNIAYGTCSTAAATAAKVITLSGNTNWALTVGSVIMVYFSNTNSASNVTLNVNGTGAYPIWYNNAAYTSTGNAYTGYAKRTIVYMFNGTHWVWITSSYDANSTYSNASLGQGYGTCSTAAATAAKVVTLSSYALTTGGIVAVKFTYDVPASATMNINSKGAKAIYYKGAAITAGVIKAGDVAVFIYNGSQYHLLAIDKRILPACTSSDDGKFLRVVSGAPAWVAIPTAEGASF